MLVKHGNEIWDCLIVPRLFPFGTSQPSSVELVLDPYRREAALMNHVLADFSFRRPLSSHNTRHPRTLWELAQNQT